jgi:hypothetical protein
MAAIFCGFVAGFFHFPNNLFTSDEIIGESSRTLVLLFRNWQLLPIRQRELQLSTVHCPLARDGGK